MNFSQTLILRHKKENLRKCSLRGLEMRPDLHFITYPTDPLPDLTGFILLTPNAPFLTKEDTAPLLLVDATWRLSRLMLEKLPPCLTRRSLPLVSTAYPRRQDEKAGLASVEALYLAHQITGRNCEGLLDHYYWRENFLNAIPITLKLCSLHDRQIL
ncbi:MAG: hypothetical protein JSR80_08170 [Verrucomicrobia bacterium]|nr:hypothetical protein [Verrucomicrobiota bacterium]